MVLRDTPWPAGYPCWVDVMTSDLEAAKAFYGGLFGWNAVDGPPEAGGYVIADVGGNPVAGLMAIPPDMAGHPSVWTTYLATDDADATAAAITANGGTLSMPPMDVMDVGRMAVAQDPTGGTFGLWQAKAHTGVHLANEPGALTWNEFMTRDYEGAKAFYGAV